MADKACTKIIGAQVIRNMSEKGQLGRNWAFEIWEFEGDASSVTPTMASDIRVPHCYQITQMETGAFTGSSFSSLLPVAGVVTITTSAAVANAKKIRIKLEGVL